MFLIFLKVSLIGTSNVYDLVWIDSGEFFGPRVLSWIKGLFQSLFVYTIDDPTGNRDACRFHTLRKSFSLYSLCVFVRQETSLEALALGAKKAITVSRSFDEIAHFEAGSDAPIEEELYPLTFLGTNIPGEKRDVFLAHLLHIGISLRIVGNMYERSRHWNKIKLYHSQAAIGSDYVSLIKSSIACLGLLSHQNRDLITTRSLEIPACSGILCGESSSEHHLIYENYVEAMFWNQPCEIPDLINRLEDPQFRSFMRQASFHRISEIGYGNEDICRYILSLL